MPIVHLVVFLVEPKGNQESVRVDLPRVYDVLHQMRFLTSISLHQMQLMMFPLTYLPLHEETYLLFNLLVFNEVGYQRWFELFSDAAVLYKSSDSITVCIFNL